LERARSTGGAYLQRTFGKVYINSAKADENVAVLTLSQKDADAIVAYRVANLLGSCLRVSPDSGVVACSNPSLPGNAP